MKLMLLVPGTGNFYCGSCLRDGWLGSALRKLGHEVVIVPLYLPLVLEEPMDRQKIRMGGINMYLQQKSALLRHLPRWIANLLDKQGLLRWVARRSKLTEAPDLGPMTVSMLKGKDGRQSTEIRKLAEWAATSHQPDVVVLSNAMLCGAAKAIKQALQRPVITTLQGEAPFLDTLPPPFSDQAWEELRRCAADIDAFVPVSHSYGETMRVKLGVADDRFHVIHNGMDLDGFEDDPPSIRERNPKTIGYLARMCRDKGVDTLIEAVSLLKEKGSIPDLRLSIAGTMLNEDRPLMEELQGVIRARGWEQDLELLPNIDRAQKLAFLSNLSVLSVPATYGESFGLYLLEAMAAGVPVVQPRHGSFPEILEATGGGILCDPDDPEALAQGLETLLLDETRSQELARHGRRAVLERFTAERMARQFEKVCQATLRERPVDTP